MQLGEATRLRPFPPPLPLQNLSSEEQPSPSVPTFGFAMASDPYMFGGFRGSLCWFRRTGPPQPPKNRTPVKERGNPFGPVHSGTGGTRDVVLEAKRGALTQANQDNSCCALCLAGRRPGHWTAGAGDAPERCRRHHGLSLRLRSTGGSRFWGCVVLFLQRGFNGASFAYNMRPCLRHKQLVCSKFCPGPELAAARVCTDVSR